MNNEIKEMSKIELFLLDLKCSTEPTLTEKGKDLLLNYITNLQEEKDDYKNKFWEEQEQSEMLKDKLEIFMLSDKTKQETIDNFRNKIDKAIEYINENKNKTIAPYGDNEDIDYETCLFEEDIVDLLNILKGED